MPLPARLFSLSVYVLSLSGCTSAAHRAAANQTTSNEAERAPALEVAYVPNHRIELPVIVNGHEVQLVLDHGADRTHISRGVSDQVGVKGNLVDSLGIGHSVLRAVRIDHIFYGYTGIVGAPELSHYDFVFDGPARRVRLYEIPADATRQIWLPPGVMPEDCTPILQRGEGSPYFVYFAIEINGKPLMGMFDSGSDAISLNRAAFRLAGLDETSPNVHPVYVNHGFTSGRPILEATHVPVTIGSKHIPVRDVPIEVFDHLPGDPGQENMQVLIGLSAILDRVFVVSYSTHQVCLAPPSSSPATSASATSGSARD